MSFLTKSSLSLALVASLFAVGEAQAAPGKPAAKFHGGHGHGHGHGHSNSYLARYASSIKYQAADIVRTARSLRSVNYRFASLYSEASAIYSHAYRVDRLLASGHVSPRDRYYARRELSHIASDLYQLKRKVYYLSRGPVRGPIHTIGHGSKGGVHLDLGKVHISFGKGRVSVGPSHGHGGHGHGGHGDGLCHNSRPLLYSLKSKLERLGSTVSRLQGML